MKCLEDIAYIKGQIPAMIIKQFYQIFVDTYGLRSEDPKGRKWR